MAIYIFLLLFPGQHIYSKASKFNSACVSWQSQLVWFFPLHSYHTVVFTRYWLQEKMELLILSFYYMSVGNGKALRLHSDTHAALPLLEWAVNSHFPVFLNSERRKNGSCCFTAALIGGITAISGFAPLWEEENWQLQLYRLSHRR